MKNIVKRFLYAAAPLMVLAACETDAPEFVVSDDNADIAFQNTFASEYLLSEVTATNVAERFIWNEPDFEAEANITYELFGSNYPVFDSATQVGSTSETNLAVTVDQLLQFAQDQGLDGNPNTTDSLGNPNNMGMVYFWVTGTVGTGGNAPSVRSDSAALNITWVEEVAASGPGYEALYVAGSFQGWDAANAVPMVKVTDDIHAVRVTFDAAGEFKVLNAQAWGDVEFGSDGAGGIEEGGGNLSGPADAGMYLLIINTADLSMEIRATSNEMFMVGDATAGGWDNTAGTQMFRTDDFTWTYTGNFTAGGFKMLTNSGQWAPQYGLTDDVLTFRPTEADPDPSTFNVDAEGYYTITANVVTGDWTFEAFDEASATDYTSMAMIGDGVGGWGDADEKEFTQSASESHVWVLTSQAINGEVKVRADDGWAANWGGEGFPYGDGEQDGPNMVVPDGTYTVYFNDLDGTYYIKAE